MPSQTLETSAHVYAPHRSGSVPAASGGASVPHPFSQGPGVDESFFRPMPMDLLKLHADEVAIYSSFDPKYRKELLGFIDVCFCVHLLLLTLTAFLLPTVLLSCTLCACGPWRGM